MSANVAGFLLKIDFSEAAPVHAVTLRGREDEETAGLSAGTKGQSPVASLIKPRG
jgi:hypothetical protein